MLLPQIPTAYTRACAGGNEPKRVRVCERGLRHHVQGHGRFELHLHHHQGICCCLRLQWLPCGLTFILQDDMEGEGQVTKQNKRLNR